MTERTELDASEPAECLSAPLNGAGPKLVVRGGGDLATGTALRLFRAGMRVVVTELPAPLAVRRTVSFAEAVYEGTWIVEEVEARLAASAPEAIALAARRIVPVLVAPDLNDSLDELAPDVIVDARLTKRVAEPLQRGGPIVIGLGPGFTAGANCDAVVETRRGHTLGRVYWTGAALADTGLPDGDSRRVLRAPAAGVLRSSSRIGDIVLEGQEVAEVAGFPVRSPFAGVLRGMVRDGLSVTGGMKIGDVDASGDRSRCFLVSDKALAIGGGVLEAVLAAAHAGRLVLCSRVTQPPAERPSWPA